MAALAIAGLVGLLVLLPGGLLAKVTLLNSGVCPQRPAHTYFIEGRQMPLEARMVGIFAGYFVTIAGLWLVGRGRALQWPRRSLSLALAALVAVMVFDGLNSTFWDLGWPALYAPQNWLRLLTGVLSGVGMAGLLLPAFSLSVWKQAYLRPTFGSWPELGLALLPALLLWCGTLAGWGPLFWPISILAVAGVITMLTMFNMIILAVLFRRENQIATFQQFVLPLVLVVWLSLGQMMLFAAMRVAAGGSLASF